MTRKAEKQILETGKLIETLPAPPSNCKIRKFTDYISDTPDISINRYKQYISQGVKWKVDNLVINKIINIVNKMEVYEGQVLKFQLSTCGACPKQKIIFEQIFRKDLRQEFCSNTLNKLYNGDLYVYIKEKNMHGYYLDYELKFK
jgi:hypothetical protein